LFRERLRLGLNRAQVLKQLKAWGIQLSAASLATTEVKDRPLPLEWLMPLTTLNFQVPDAESAPVLGAKEAESRWTNVRSFRIGGTERHEDSGRGTAWNDATGQEAQLPPSSASTLLLELSKEEEQGDEPPWLYEVTKHAQVAAIRAAMKAAAPTSDVSVGQFLQAWIACEAAWKLIKVLPLFRFWTSFHPYPTLLVPEEPKEEPFAALLPKLLAFHLQRETVLQLARPDLSEMTLTGDFFTGLARVGALEAIESFPFLTFCYAMEFGFIPLTPIMTTEEVDSALKAETADG
jgi:hypothetical protein